MVQLLWEVVGGADTGVWAAELSEWWKELSITTQNA